MITVIVDTTSTFDDVMLKSTAWMQILTLCHMSRIEVVLPDVVLRETARHWEAGALEAIQIANGKIAGLKKSRERLVEMGIDTKGLVDSETVNAKADKSGFEEATREKLLSLGVRVEPIPEHVDVETILQRDLARKKPFSPSGKGFRDALVWETVKAVVLTSAANAKNFFVTNNTGDYCQAGGLAPELEAEVKNAAGKLLWVANLEELLKHGALAPMVAGLAKTSDELAKFLAFATTTRDEGAEPLPVEQVVKEAVISALENLNGEDVKTDNAATTGLNFSGLGIPSELEGLSIDAVDADASSLTWQTYETYDDTTLLIQAEIEAEITLDGFAYKSDVGYLVDDDGNIRMLEWDWNDHMAHVGTTVMARLSFQIRLEQGADFVEECEFEGAQPTWPASS
ncbi:DUF4935 domain-containing protein [Actinoplanes bogorensis]|uniref:DUF4935 domain-containing protein n=1 Tax=Paractinoplanes bogorensis TaxID=1610840 RepID=A0ABS5Z2L8_9ACTN|nr:PIN domain-containing protein [Actinoplanes bogorensis]MBU2669935.1 DUF4935 domain-containing protein [Actinoplanes bogorensis]